MTSETAAAPESPLEVAVLVAARTGKGLADASNPPRNAPLHAALAVNRRSTIGPPLSLAGMKLDHCSLKVNPSDGERCGRHRNCRQSEHLSERFGDPIDLVARDD